MAIFPEDIDPIYPVIIEPVWDTLIHRADSGAEQRRQKTLYPRYNVKLKFTGLSAADAQTLWNFYMARKGSFEEFYFYDPAPDAGIVTSYDNVYIATGDGSNDTWDIPGKSTSSQIIYVDGITKALTADYTILIGGGDGDADRVAFVTPPAVGASVSCDFTGKLRVNCRFASDRLSKEMFFALLAKFEINLLGLAGN